MANNWEKVRFPDSCKGENIIIGIDEAGRGPVLGSLFYCAAFWPEKENEEISALGFDDSKVLKEGEREKFFDKIRSHPSIGWVVEELTAEHLSEEMMRGKSISLNVLSSNGVIRMLEKIRDCFPESPMTVTDVFVDTVGDPDHYKNTLVRAMGTNFAQKFTVEKKADANYKVVSAASIIAKVTRDNLTSGWAFVEGPDVLSSIDTKFGSGYPGDERCVEWMHRAFEPIFGYPNIVRFSWGTTREMLVKKGACNVKWECDEEESGTEDIASFFKVGDKRPKKLAYANKLKIKNVLSNEFLM